MLYSILVFVLIVSYISYGYWVQVSTQSDFKGIIIWWLPIMVIMWLIRKKWLPFGCITCNDKDKLE